MSKVIILITQKGSINSHKNHTDWHEIINPTYLEIFLNIELAQIIVIVNVSEVLLRVFEDLKHNNAGSA